MYVIMSHILDKQWIGPIGLYDSIQQSFRMIEWDDTILRTMDK